MSKQCVLMLALMAVLWPHVSARAAKRRSKPAPAAVPAPAPSPVVESDPLRVGIAVMDLQADASLGEGLADGLVATIARVLSRLGPFRVVSKRDIVNLLQYRADRQALGCEDVSCFSDLGDALGADYLITGSLAAVEGEITLELQLLSVASKSVTQRVARERLPEEALADEAKSAVQILVRPLLELRSGQLALRVSEEGATVLVDDAVVGSTPLPSLHLGGGMHRVEIEKEGFVRFRRDVSVQEGVEVGLDAVLMPSRAYVESYEANARLWRAGAWTLLGVGVAALGGGASLLVLSRQQAVELNHDLEVYNASIERSSAVHDDLARRRQRVAAFDGAGLAGLGVGVASVAAGALMYWLGDDPQRYRGSSSVGVAVAPQGTWQIFWRSGP